MANENQLLNKFRPERPIYLNEDNTGLKTKDEVIVAVEKLRLRGFLCAYSEVSRPFHMSFNDVLGDFEDFKKAAAECGVKLKNPPAVIDDADFDKAAEPEIKGAKAKASFEDTKGKVHITG